MDTHHIKPFMAVVALFVALSFGCGTADTAEPSTVTHNGTTREKTISVEDMRFADAGLEAKLRRFNAAANQFAKPGWHRRPYRTLNAPLAKGVYYAEWANFADENGRNPINYQGPNEMHCISISAYLNADDPDPQKRNEIVGVDIYAKWRPASSAWEASLCYRTVQPGSHLRKNGAGEVFWFSCWPVLRKGDTDQTVAGIHFNRTGAAVYNRTFRFGSGDQASQYEFLISTENHAYDAAKAVEMPDSDVLQILSSAESLRDFGVTALEALVEKIETDIPSGKALKPVLFDRMLEYGEAPSELKSDRPLTQSELSQVLDEARRETQLQIDSLRKHYKEMHQALERAFPIKECLQAAKEGDNARQ